MLCWPHSRCHAVPCHAMPCHVPMQKMQLTAQHFWVRNIHVEEEDAKGDAHDCRRV